MRTAQGAGLENPFRGTAPLLSKTVSTPREGWIVANPAPGAPEAPWLVWLLEGVLEVVAVAALLLFWYAALPAIGVTKLLVAQLGPFADLSVVLFLFGSLYAAVRSAYSLWGRLSKSALHPVRVGALIALGVVLGTGLLSGGNPLLLDLLGLRFTNHGGALVLLGALSGWIEGYRRRGPSGRDAPRFDLGKTLGRASASRPAAPEAAAATRRRIATRASRR